MLASLTPLNQEDGGVTIYSGSLLQYVWLDVCVGGMAYSAMIRLEAEVAGVWSGWNNRNGVQNTRQRCAKPGFAK